MQAAPTSTVAAPATTVARARTSIMTQAFLVWAMFTVLGFLPEFFFQLYRRVDGMAVIFEPLADQPQSAWALATHFAGFAVFLFMTTNKKRWLVIPVVSTVWFMWIWRWFHLPREWWSFATHTLGYFVMGMALLMVMGVLSGLVYLWVELLGFLRQLWIFYPQVKHELRSHPLLEAVIVSASRPSALGSEPMGVVVDGCPRQGANDRLDQHSGNTSKGHTNTHRRRSVGAMGTSSELTSDSALAMRKIVTIDKVDDSARCFLCKRPAVAYVEVCTEWTRPNGTSDKASFSVCTPFTTLRDQHRRATEMLHQAQKACVAAQGQRDALVEANEDLIRKIQEARLQQQLVATQPPVPVVEKTGSRSPLPLTRAPITEPTPAPTPTPVSTQEPQALLPPLPVTEDVAMIENVAAPAGKKEREVRYLVTVIRALEQQLEEKDHDYQQLQDLLHQNRRESDDLQAKFNEKERQWTEVTQTLERRLNDLERERRLMNMVGSRFSV